MLKVICINHARFGRDTFPYGPDDPQIGDECTVLNMCIGYCKDGSEAPCYELEGYGGDEYVYDQRNFATLPDTTADEMQEAEKEAIVNLETVLV